MGLLCRQKKAFTLIEIIVAVIIIGVLATIGSMSYLDQKKRVEYNSAVANIRTIAAASKNYFIGQVFYVDTTDTAQTNTRLGLNVNDAYFSTYRVNVINSTAFNITVFSGTPTKNATYTFNSDGVRIACSGTDCLP